VIYYSKDFTADEVLFMDYMIYVPGGNDTALVLGDDFPDKAAVNDELIKKHPNVEQVGFLNLDKPKLTMAGGEFCGNAVRCACHYYLKGKSGEIEIEICGQFVKCGIDKEGDVWVELPKPEAKKIAKGMYLVEMDGITHIVVEKEKLDAKCLGLIPLDGDSINPFVWVKGVNTFFNETGCLSGTAAAAAVSGKQLFKQPSGADYKVEYGEEKDGGKIRVSGHVRLDKPK